MVRKYKNYVILMGGHAAVLCRYYLTWVWSQCGENMKIKTTKISSEGLTCMQFHEILHYSENSCYTVGHLEADSY